MYMQSSKVEANKDFEFIAGTAASPSAMFASDNDTGFYSLGANKIVMATGGVARLGIGDSGEILVGGSAAGTSGQFLTSGGSGAAVSWTTSSGGGSTDIPLAPAIKAAISGSDVRQYPLIAQTGAAETNSNGVLNFNTSTAMFFPFFAPVTGDIQSLTCRLVSANDDDITICLFRS